LKKCIPCPCLGRYLLIKLFPDLSLQRFLDAYFWLIGSIAVAGNLVPPLRQSVLAPPDMCLHLHTCACMWHACNLCPGFTQD
jgi:hypothetical protein